LLGRATKENIKAEENHSGRKIKENIEAEGDREKQKDDIGRER